MHSRIVLLTHKIRQLIRRSNNAGKIDRDNFCRCFFNVTIFMGYILVGEHCRPNYLRPNT